MWSYFIKFFFIFVFISTIANAEIIKNIEIKGNKRISNETIVVLSDIKIGTKFNNINLNKSLKQLFETNFFSDVKFSMEDETLLMFRKFRGLFAN